MTSGGSDRDVRERRILDVLMALGTGEVTTYGDVAEVAGYPKLARLVGHIVATTDVDVPWWRVVNAAGRLRAGGDGADADHREQAARLRAEGVIVEGDRVRRAPVGRFSRPSGRAARCSNP